MGLIESTDELRRTLTQHDVVHGVQRLNENTQAILNMADALSVGTASKNSDAVCTGGLDDHVN